MHSNNVRTSGIVGGMLVSESTEIRASTVLLMQIQSSGAVGGVCTGTLIAEDMVLTAAHCAPDQSQILIGFGNTIELSRGPEAKHQPRKVQA
ncbi:MAG: trypsin-like serine protease, partial [Proteobacteria bacterium]